MPEFRVLSIYHADSGNENGPPFSSVGISHPLTRKRQEDREKEGKKTGSPAESLRKVRKKESGIAFRRRKWYIHQLICSGVETVFYIGQTDIIFMRLANYLFKTFADKGLDTVFFLTGGGAAHLNDALGQEKRLRRLCCLHEQACAMAAEGYARVRNIPAIVSVATGPGGTNAITGVAGAYLDSIPMLVISGQVKTETMLSSCPGLKLRQYGDQELDIIPMVRPITKYAVTVTDPSSIRRELERALHTATSGRPGSVWLDIPLDIQAAEVDPETLPGWTPEEKEEQEEEEGKKSCQVERLGQMISLVARRLRSATRPVMIAGNGVRLAGAAEAFRNLSSKLGIPVLTSISGIDLLPSDSPCFFGRPGILGERAANYILQNSDLALIIGSRMGIRMTGYSFGTFLRDAFRIMVDVDPDEMRRPNLRIDCPVHCDAAEFIALLDAQFPTPFQAPRPWLDYCRNLRRRYPVVTAAHRQRRDYVSSYVFPELLASSLADGSVVVTGNGTAYTSTYQSFPVRPGIRIFANQGCAAMGYDLPAAIGAAFGAPGREIICITGDGSIQMNIQELQTIVSANLPIKIFCYNNNGYLSIKLTQHSFFPGRRIGSDPDSGVHLPDLGRLASAYGIPFFRMRNHEEAAALLPEILRLHGPVLCEVMTDPMEELGPKAASRLLPDGRILSRPLEDLAPLLDRAEHHANMLIPEPEEDLLKTPEGNTPPQHSPPPFP